MLAAFMGGLALGNAGVALYEGRIRHAPRAYFAVELAIGLSGVATLVLLTPLIGLFARLFQTMDTTGGVNAVRGAAAFLMFLMPAAGMGATLPLLVKCSNANDPNSFGARLGMLYASNTAGAVVGALLSELVLVPAVGVTRTGVLAAILNVVSGLLALTFLQPDSVRTTRFSSRAEERTVVVGSARPFLIAGFLSGAVFLAFEAALFRFQLLFFTSLSRTFAIMLAVVLAGIALGSAIAARLLRRHARLDVLLPLAALGGGIALPIAYRVFASVLSGALTLGPTAAILLTTAFLALPIAVLSGMLFTALAQAVKKAGHTDIRATALLTIANTCGATLGSLVCGLYLIGAFGLEATFVGVVVGYGVIGVLLIAAGGVRAPAGRVWRLVGVAAFVLSLLQFPAGAMESIYQRFPVNALAAVGERRVAFREGRLETLQYLRADTLGQPDYFRLVVNNHSMAATDIRSRRYMRLFAHFASILHPAPERAALLGLGLGVTAKALTEDDRLRSIDIVDISPDVVEMLPVLYPDPAANPLRDKRVRVQTEDGRFFLLSSRESFDVITAEPPPPHYAGISNLYSREFFSLVADRLTLGGIATYWLPVHDLKVSEAQAILRAFLDVFPDGSLWTGSGLDWMMVGVRPPSLRVTEAQFTSWWAREPIADRLREIGVEDPESLGALFIADGDRLRAWLGDTPALTDDFPRRISIGSPRDETDVAALIGLMSAPEAPANFLSSPSIGALWPGNFRERSIAKFERQSRLNAMLSLPALGVRELDQLFKPNPRDPLLIKAAFWRFFYDFDRTRDVLSANPALTGDGLAEYRAQTAMMAGNFKEAADWLAQANGARARYLRSLRDYCLFEAGMNR